MIRSTARRRSVLVAFAAAALVLAGCGSSADSGTSSGADPNQRAGNAPASAADNSAGSGAGSAGAAAPAGPASGSYTLGVSSYFVEHFMPGNSGGSDIGYALFTPLTEYDAQAGKLLNVVAESVESADQKVWDITLRSGWTFHNGEAVTAQSFADSWNATANPKNAMTNILQMSPIAGYEQMNPTSGEPTATELSGVKVVDDLHLTVTLSTPNALFPYLLSSSAFAPIPKEAATDFAAFDRNPIGNGPFMMTGGGMKSGDQEVVFQAYPNYAGADAARAESITVRSYVDSAAIYTDFQAGTLDLMLIDGPDLADAQAQFPDQVVPVDYPAVVYVGFPTWDKRFDNIKLRQAISLAIDRQSIVDALLKGNGTVATSVAPATLIGGGQNDCDVCSYDVERAKQLLAEAGGFQGGLTLYTYSDPTMEEVLNAVANQLRSNLGIEATAQTQPVSQLYDNFKQKSLEGAFLLYSGSSNPHLYGEVSSLFTTGSSLNAAAYQSDTVDQQIDAALAQKDDAAFTAGIQQAAKTALADLPLAPLYYPRGGLLHSTRVSGVVPELLGSADLSKVTVTG